MKHIQGREIPRDSEPCHGGTKKELEIGEAGEKQAVEHMVAEIL